VNQGNQVIQECREKWEKGVHQVFQENVDCQVIKDLVVIRVIREIKESQEREDKKVSPVKEDLVAIKVRKAQSVRKVFLETRDNGEIKANVVIKDLWVILVQLVNTVFQENQARKVSQVREDIAENQDQEAIAVNPPYNLLYSIEIYG